MSQRFFYGRDSLLIYDRILPPKKNLKLTRHCIYTERKSYSIKQNPENKSFIQADTKVNQLTVMINVLC